MKRFIRYLYEYNQGKRLRNVGFVKVELGEEECAVHIHGKGLHMRGERKLSLYLFYEEGNECVGIWQGEVDNVNPAINYRLYYTKEDEGMPENFQRINGIILESETGHRYAAVWDDMPVDIEHMRVWRQRSERLEERMRKEVEQREDNMADAPEKAEESEIESERCEHQELKMEPDRSAGMASEGTSTGQASSERMSTEEMSREQMPTEDMSREQMPTEEMSQEQVSTEDMSQEQVSTEEMSREQTDSKEDRPRSPFKCTKIQRSELSCLPRCEWKWANNSFLLHGYYNYHHLVFLDDGEGLRLGVPGIYHPQEAKAAGAFGFAEFIPARDIHIELTEEERNDQEQFGYWCRWVKRQK